MNIGEQLFWGGGAYIKAFRILDQHRLWRILILPALLSLVMAIIIGVLAWMTSDDIVLYINRQFTFRDHDSRIGNLIELAIAFIVRGITLFLFLKLYRYLILVFLSPLFVRVSSLLHREIDGSEEKLSIWSFCFCSFRGIKLALRNFFLELLITLILLFFALIVVWIAPLIPALILIVESYFFGMVMMDYSYEMDGADRKESLQMVRRNAGIAIGNGLIFSVIVLIPLLGVIFAPILSLLAARVAIDETKNAKFYVNPIHKPI